MPVNLYVNAYILTNVHIVNSIKRLNAIISSKSLLTNFLNGGLLGIIDSIVNLIENRAIPKRYCS